MRVHTEDIHRVEDVTITYACDDTQDGPHTSVLLVPDLHTPDATYEPYASPNGALGFRVLLPSGVVRYVYLNPSGDSDDGVPNVFLYEGPTGDPAQDTPVTYLDITGTEV